jgi:outer membrane protein assembly factor BamB
MTLLDRLLHRSLSVLMFGSCSIAQVSQEWLARFGEPGMSTNVPIGMEIDRQGNVFVLGGSWAVTRDSGFPLSSERGFVLLKYDSQGKLLWSEHVPEGDAVDLPADLALDDSGNAYITGELNWEFYVMKFDALGERLWTSTLPDSWNGSQGTQVRVDYRGDVVAAGSVNDAVAGNRDFVVAKFDPDGALLWETRYDGPPGKDDDVVTMELGHTGHVHVSGTSSRGINYAGQAATTLELDGLGCILWARQYSTPFIKEEVPIKIAVDGRGSSIVTGYSSPVVGMTPHGPIDIWTAKYDSRGQLLWSETFDGQASNADYPKDVAVDSHGNVVVVGSTVIAPWHSEGVVLKYGADGGLQWQVQLDEPCFAGSGSYSVAIDGSGNAYVLSIVGSQSCAPVAALRTSKLDPDGMMLWQAHFSSQPQFSWCYPRDLDLDPLGNVYITAQARLPEDHPFYDIVTIKYVQ